MTWAKKKPNRSPKIVSRHKIIPKLCRIKIVLVITDTDLSFSGRRATIFPRNFVVTTQRLVLRDNAQETNFVLDTLIVLTNGFHQPATCVHCNLGVVVLLIASHSFDVARGSEEVG